MDKALNLRLGANLNDNRQGFTGNILVPRGLVGLLRLILGQLVAKLVDARLIQSLQRLKHKRSLRLPLLLSRLELGRRRISLLRIGLAALLVQLIRFLLGVLEILGHGAKVVRDGVHVLDIGSLLESSERLLNISFDALGKLVVRLGDSLDCTCETCPGRVEDTWTWSV